VTKATSSGTTARAPSAKGASSRAATPARKRRPKQPKPPDTPGVARIVAIANQKGGVGKSTTAVSLGAALADLGYRVLVVDLDPQGNASTGLGIKHELREVTVYDVILSEAPVMQAVVNTPVAGLSAIPSTIDLAGAEIELVSQFSREARLKKALAEVSEGVYDFILLDCPPSLGLLTVNALTAAEELIVPIQCEYYALEGLGQLLRNVSLVQTNINPDLRISGIVMTMFDPRTNLSEQVVAEVRKFFGDLVYDVIIPRTVRLSEAPGFGQPITLYDPKSKGAESYRELAREVALRPPPEGPMPVYQDLPAVAPAEPTTIPKSDAAATVPEPEESTEPETQPTVEVPEPEPEPDPEPVAEASVELEPDPGPEPELDPVVELADEPVNESSPSPVPAAVEDDDVWEDQEASAARAARVSEPRSPAPPGRLPERRVVVIDEDAADYVTAPSSTQPSEATDSGEHAAVADIGATLEDDDEPKRRWRLFRKGGDE
jgi:chromosome partitioning protein